MAAPVPEPATMLLMGSAFWGLGLSAADGSIASRPPLQKESGAASQEALRFLYFQGRRFLLGGAFGRPQLAVLGLQFADGPWNLAYLTFQFGDLLL